MFSDKIKARLTGLALIGAVFTVPGAASAGVVVKSSGPSAGEYPVGRQVNDSATITLQAGDKITVLTDSGTSVMQGPGNFRVGEGATRTRARFSNLSRRSAAGRARTGAVRGAPTDAGSTPPEGPQSPPNLWYVDLEAQGTICLYDLDRVQFWRAIQGDPQTYRIQDQTTMGTLEVNFVTGEPFRSWDATVLPLVPGRNYTITGPFSVASSEEAGEGEEAPAAPMTTPSTTVVTFAALGESYRQQDKLAEALISNGCTAQLGQLADELEAYAEANAS